MAKTINTTSTINTHVASAINAAVSYGGAITALTQALKVQGVPFERKAVAQALMQPVADYYKVTLVAKVRGEGTTWGEGKADMAAKQTHKRLLASIFNAPKAEQSEEECEIPAELLALAAKMVKAAAAYEGSAKLVARALATARTK